MALKAFSGDRSRRIGHGGCLIDPQSVAYLRWRWVGTTYGITPCDQLDSVQQSTLKSECCAVYKIEMLWYFGVKVPYSSSSV
jgi:hypothetical protein